MTTLNEIPQLEPRGARVRVNKLRPGRGNPGRCCEGQLRKTQNWHTGKERVAFCVSYLKPFAAQVAGMAYVNQTGLRLHGPVGEAETR